MTVVAADSERPHRPVVMGLFDDARLSLEQVTETHPDAIAKQRAAMAEYWARADHRSEAA